MVSKKEEERKHHSRNKSIKEGMFNAAKVSFGENYISPFAIAIGTSNSLVAMLTSITGFLGPLSQTLGPKPGRKLTRKKIVMRAIFFESLMWIPFILTAILFYLQIAVVYLPFLLLFSFVLMTIFANLGVPAWFSWVGDLVDEKFRGRWFSKRTMIIGFVTIVLTIFSSLLLEYADKKNIVMFGFGILFLLALVFRLFSWKITEKQYEPKMKIQNKEKHPFLEFIKSAPKTNFGKFVLFRCSIAFSAAISSPLISVYLLRDLNLSYISYMVIIMGGTFFSLFSLELWGKFADRYGNYKTIVLSASLTAIVPILWILNESPLYLLLIPATLEGILWAGLLLAAGNFIYDNAPVEKRASAVSHYNMLWGIGVLLGASTGALLIGVLKTSLLKPIVVIFILSALLRVVAVLFWAPKIKEIRKTDKFKGIKSVEEILMKETKSTIKEEVHQLMSIKKYLRA